MAGPKPASGWRVGPVRLPAFAGMFYPDDAGACVKLAESFVGVSPAGGSADETRWIGGIVPHAGWICSGAIAGQTIAAVAEARRSAGVAKVDVVVVFGAIHSTMVTDYAALDSHAAWSVPGGESELQDELQQKLLEASSLVRVDERLHRQEHAIEVELPLIQRAWPGARVLPVEVPVTEEAWRVGVATAREVMRSGQNAVYLASSDLTHYGPAYDLVVGGVGLEGLAWAKDNDRRLLERVERMEIESIVPEVMGRMNACGGGAIAAMLAACREAGATGGRVLRHANSYETLAEVAPQRPDNAVGYAAVVVG